MSQPSPSEPLFRRLTLRLAGARFLTFSALLHVIIVLLAGSVVMFRHVPDPPDFEGGGSLVSSDTTVSPPNTEDQPKPEDFQPSVTPPAASSALDIIASTSSAPTVFTLGAASLPKIDSKLGSGADIGKAIDGKIGAAMAAAGGRIGGKMAAFGSKEKTVPSLTGTFYDLKQTKKKEPTNFTNDDYQKVVREFQKKGWSEAILNEYFKAPNPLYASQIMVPNMKASEGPKAFGMEKEVQPSRWLALYKGRVSPPADGKYHFVGGGDDIMIVRFNGKTVLDRCWQQNDTDWQADKNYKYGFSGIPNGFARGDRLELRAGTYYDIEVLIGERPGGFVYFSLLVEKEGEDYQKDAHGNPILPVFRLANMEMPELKDGQTQPPFAPDGPVWSAQASKSTFSTAFGK